MNDPILLIPLDERPVNTVYPQMLASIGGADLLLPPSDFLGFQKEPANLEAVFDWLENRAKQGASAAVVSADFLGFGNLINARISQESASDVIGRLCRLGAVNELCPVHAFSLITRTPNANDNVEEPNYWGEWGTRIYRYAYLTRVSEKKGLTDQESREYDALSEEIPSELITDWLIRRLRNHTVNLALMDMAGRGQIESLAMSFDDTAPYSFATRERDWLRGWDALIGPPLSDRFDMYPGADEVGSMLVARVINENNGRSPRVWIDYAIPGDERIVAPYEDCAVKMTILSHISACGAIATDDVNDADFVLGVVTPSPRRTDYRLEYLETDRGERGEAYAAFLGRLNAYQDVKLPVAIADLAYPNGADPLFSEMLIGGKKVSELSIAKLAAYGAWNTAGNTLGVVIAQAALSIYATSSSQKLAQKLFLAHRFLEDCAYQGFIRRAARDEAQRLWGRRDPKPDCAREQDAMRAFIERELIRAVETLRVDGVAKGIELVPGSIRLPWRRLFEADFKIRAV